MRTSVHDLPHQSPTAQLARRRRREPKIRLAKSVQKVLSFRAASRVCSSDEGILGTYCRDPGSGLASGLGQARVRLASGPRLKTGASKGLQIGS